MSDRELRAMDVVKKYSLYSGGVGLLPFPLADGIAVAAIQLRMLKKLARDVYGIPFGESLGKGVLTALVGGSAPAIGTGMAFLVYQIPFIGPAASAITVST